MICCDSIDGPSTLAFGDKRALGVAIALAAPRLSEGPASAGACSTLSVVLVLDSRNVGSNIGWRDDCLVSLDPSSYVWTLDASFVRGAAGAIMRGLREAGIFRDERDAKGIGLTA